MTFSFLLVILGQPNYTDKKFRNPLKHQRRVKKVHVHPDYRRKPASKDTPKEKMPIFDFALIEVLEPIYSSYKHYNVKFEPTVRPICLPSKWMGKYNFVGEIAKVSGYGRIEAKKIDWKNQNSMQLKEADLRITGKKDKTCEKVMFSYIIIKALDCLVGRM